jgi:hypothetical protein
MRTKTIANIRPPPSLDYNDDPDEKKVWRQVGRAVLNRLAFSYVGDITPHSLLVWVNGVCIPDHAFVLSKTRGLDGRTGIMYSLHIDPEACTPGQYSGYDVVAEILK